MLREEPPEGIVITISQGMLKEKGLSNWLRNFLKCMNREQCSYWMRQGVKPKMADHLMYVYLCIGGKIRYRANFAGTCGPKYMVFDDDKGMYAKVWIVMTGPVVKPDVEVPWKGFRGFRYTQKLF